MSGEHFDCKQHRIDRIAADIENLIRDNNDNRILPWGVTVGRHYTPETIRRFKVAVTALRMAGKMANRIDYLVSEDDGEETFLQRWDEDLRI